MTTLSKADAEFVAELKKLREQQDPDEARKTTESLPEIGEGDTLAVGFNKKAKNSGKSKARE